MDLSTEGFSMKDYGRQSVFSSFLPGIAGVKGIPIWCYYVNRGQGVVSFGVDNKDHAIMEFYPAHTAYQNVKRTGFRTFIRKDNEYVEAFRKERTEQEMQIFMNSLELTDDIKEQGLKIHVEYFILPEEQVGALVRKVTVTNQTEESCKLELLDGMPALIPYGVNDDSMKSMTQTAKAWMQVEEYQQKIPFYRVRASMEDSSSVKMIEGGNFALCVDHAGERMDCITDPQVIFSYDNSLDQPVVFEEEGIAGVATSHQNTSNLMPCCFFMKESTLAAGEHMELYELIGQVENQKILGTFLKQPLGRNFFEKKKERAEELTRELCGCIETKTGDERFDAYCKYTYMDNVLRGGKPIQLGHNKVFYVYSRKHGDLERDYNYFSMLPEVYSQGNGNFRDVNQNRRMDTFFSPFVGRENIHNFYSLIQLDGYNPLGVEKITYHISAENKKIILDSLEEQQRRKLEEFLEKDFTPGKLYEMLADIVGKAEAEGMFTSLIDFSQDAVQGNFIEGYWSDHWDYNMDLIEEYVSVYPECEKEMLFEKSYRYFLSQENINPRGRRYALTENGVRQYHALNEQSKRTTEEKWVREDYGTGGVLTSTLLEKLLLLCTVKFAALDSYGMGIEMEGGKPGWYDALNGMPGMLGSSMAETYELARMMDYVIKVLHRYPKQMELMEELHELLQKLDAVNSAQKETLKKDREVVAFWNGINEAKESYREKVYEGVSGKRIYVPAEKLETILKSFRETLQYGMDKADTYGGGICPTYFTYEVKKYHQNEKGIMPDSFEVQMVPHFLEGPVRYLKTKSSYEERKRLYDNIKKSDLYDSTLKMYKVNASLENASFELGRAKAFTHGWLENESIWLHMEYKYLLELLKTGMYEEFISDFHDAAVPFMNEKVYGRSILENSSFIASSRNPDKRIHGKGFVARLSGSTVEFLNMWKIMMFGNRPIRFEEGELLAEFEPMIPKYLLDEKCEVQAMFLGHTRVIYQFAERKDYIPGHYQITSIKIRYGNGADAEIRGHEIRGTFAKEIRDGHVESIKIHVE